MNEKKYLEKLKYQKKVNPGNKTSYQQPFRGRSTVFVDRTKYNRQKAKRQFTADLEDFK